MQEKLENWNINAFFWRAVKKFESLRIIQEIKNNYSYIKMILCVDFELLLACF
jgi:hypothetical protein